MLQLEACCSLGLAQPHDWREGGPEASDTDAPLQQDLPPLEASIGPALSEDSQDLSDHFPCIADELEEQAKQLEEEWLCSSQPSKPELGPPALRDTAFELFKRMLATQQAEEQRRLQAAAAAEQQAEQPATSGGACDEQQQTTRRQEQQQQQGEEASAGAGAPAREEPCTPQRHSAGDSSWNESPLPGSLEDYAEVQSPAPVKLMGMRLPGAAAPTCAPDAAGLPLPPLAVAIYNAQRVRLGQAATPGAWRGCGRSAWCSLAPRHASACDARAAVPGLLAYPSSDLFESGVNIEELCRVPEELIDQLAPDTESEGEGAAAAPCGSGAAANDCLSSGKRRAEGEADADSHSQSGCYAAGSSGAADGAGAGAATAAVKRLRTDASSSPAALAAGFPPMPLPLPASAAAAAAAPAGLQPLLAGAAADVVAASCPRMVPVHLPLPLAAPLLAPPVPAPLGSTGSALSRNRGRPAGAPRLRPLVRVEPPPVPAPGPVSHTPSKPVTRQKQHSPPGTVYAPRASGRKAVMQWHTDCVTDPRTGAAVTVVQPGTFCTQCCALSTPVWRAGPFGHKTLCNACGVRWMKYSKGSKK